ncbi:Hpt domain-containing protein [Rhodocyclus gracilis]|uniref:Chemotaxis protein CheA n=1 Tax=Rhodocyclus tenuis TaxID=1066 RepID=A0A6L5JXG1_RHOTE|nr:Hpt domain-containing protein [Rhodocyclus gracilis]MQY51512.1 response regulator [Rhodocyclus gracilis]
MNAATGMNAAAEVIGAIGATGNPPGPLLPVSREIERALALTGEALAQFADCGEAMPFGASTLPGASEAFPLAAAEASPRASLNTARVTPSRGTHAERAATPLAVCRQQLAQVRGAFQLAGDDGLALLCAALADLIDDAGRRPDTTHHVALAQRALDRLGDALTDRLAGLPAEGLHLLPLLRELQRAAGRPLAAPGALFFPDLSRPLPPRAAPSLTAAQQQLVLRRELPRFQRGLLAFLRSPNKDEGIADGIADMRNAVERIDTAKNAEGHIFWRIAAAFLGALAERALPSDCDVTPLLARLDLQIRRVQEGTPGIALALTRDLLYALARSGRGNEAVREIQDAFALPSLIPGLRIVAAAPGAAPEAIKAAASGEESDAAQPQAATPAPSQSAAEPTLPAPATGASLPEPDNDAPVAGTATTEFASHDATDAAPAPTPEEQPDPPNGTPDAASDTTPDEHRRAVAHLGAAARASEVAWLECWCGEASLPRFRRHAARLAAAADALGNTDCRRLTQCIVAAGNWIADPATALDDTLAREVACAILLLQRAPALLPAPGADFLHEVDLTVARVHACFAGNPPTSAAELPALQTLADYAQQRRRARQQTGAIRNALECIEQTLDTLAQAPQRYRELSALPPALRALADTFAGPALADTGDALRHCARRIGELADAGSAPANDDFLPLAEALTRIAQLIEAQSHAPTHTSVAPDIADPVRAAQLWAQSVEHGLERDKRLAQAALQNHRADPADEARRDALRQHLSSLQNTAELVGDTALRERARSALLALIADDATDGADRRRSPIDPTLDLRHASTRRPAPPDANWLGVFIEEAHEMLFAIAESRARLASGLRGGEALAALRRALHTLKGSAYMVGLRAFGDTARALEHTAKDWQPRASDAPPALTDLFAEAERLLSAWVEHLASGSGDAPDPSALLAQAAALRAAAANVDASRGADVIELGRFRPPRPPLDGTREDAPDAATEETGEDAADASEGHTPPDADPDVSPESQAALPAQSEPAPPTDTAQETPETPPLRRQQIKVSSSLWQIFLDEAQVHLDTLERELAQLTATPAAPTSAAFHRAAHTLGSIAGTVGLQAVNALGVALEHALQRRRHTPQPAASEALTVLRAAIDALGHMLAATAAHRLPDAAPALVATLEAIYPASADALAADAVAEFTAEPVDAPPTTPACAAPPDMAGALPPPAADTQPVAPPPTASAASSVSPHSAAAPRQREILARQLGHDVVSALDELLYGASAEPSPSAASAVNGTSGTHTADTSAAPPTASAISSAPTTPTAPATAGECTLGDELDEQLLPIFLEEASDLEHRIEAALRACREDLANGEAARALARLLHTLKGSARMAGAMRLGDITHAIETRVEALAHSTPADGTASDAIDAIESAVDAVLEEIDSLRAGGAMPPETSTAALADVDAPPAASARPDASANERRLADRERRDSPSASDDDALTQRSTLRVRADLVDRLVNEAGELSIARARIGDEVRALKDTLLELTDNVLRLRRQLHDVDLQAETQMTAHSAPPATATEAADTFDPLEFDRFTRFQELTRMMAESVDDVATIQQQLLQHVDAADTALVAQTRLSRALQQELLDVRKAPFGSIADRLYRIVRQTAKDTGKRANLDLHGSRIDIDRGVLDRLAAPLEHLLRNAVVHGIEAREERRAKGKSEIGEIALTLQQTGNELILTLSDDGGGLDFARIRAHAREAGLLDDDASAATAPDSERKARLVELIFAPGFSTAELSQVAGRGVGLDVVKTEIAQLGGRIEVDPAPTQGTTFRLTVPLTLALMQALLVDVGGATYAIPSTMIEQALDLKAPALAPLRESGAGEWQGQRYPFRTLGQLLGENVPETPPAHAWVLLLKSGAQRLAIEVEALRGAQEIVVKNVGPQLSRVGGIDAATVLGDGKIVLIVNPVALAARPLSAPPPAPHETPVNSAATVPTLMVVDDSLTVRKVTGRLLEREGYRVLTARDGVDALEQLRQTRPAALLVDIEMPRMDGFDLTRAIRADTRLKDVPIIMITSRTAEKHRQYAASLGVDRYFGKPYQETELLASVAALVRDGRNHLA